MAFPTKNILLLGGTALGIAFLYNKSQEVKEGSGAVGSFGSPDENSSFLPETGGVNDGVTVLNSYYYDLGREIPPIVSETPDDSSPSEQISKPSSGGGKSSSDIPIVTPNPPDKGTSPSSLADIPLAGYGLGVLGLTGSYATALGGQLGKKALGIGDDVGTSLLKKTYKQAVEDIPVIGKKVAPSLADSAGKRIAIDVGGEVAESAGKGIFKGGIKTGAKVGIGMIPIVGTVAGSEFDVKFSGKNRAEAYTANIVGDLLGGALVVGGAFIGVSETGVGAVALGVGGQVAGEQAVYGVSNKFFKGESEEDKKIRIQRETDIASNFYTGKGVYNPASVSNAIAVSSAKNYYAGGTAGGIYTNNAVSSTPSKNSQKSTSSSVNYSSPSNFVDTGKVSTPKKSSSSSSKQTAFQKKYAGVTKKITTYNSKTGKKTVTYSK